MKPTQNLQHKGQLLPVCGGARGASRVTCGVLALTATAALAQGTGGAGAYGGFAGSTLLNNAVAADTGGDDRPFYLTPTLSGNLTATDNVNLSASDKQSDLILQLSPGIQLGGRSGRVRGFLNYNLTASFYANEREASTFYNTLNAQVSAEAVPNRAFVDASASISQQYISPFGRQSPDPSLNNPNRTEVSTITVAPRVEGQLAGQVDYVGRLFYGYTSSGTSLASDSSAFGALLSFDSTTRWSRLGWGLNFSYRSVDFSEGRREFDQLNWVTLRYEVVPDLVLSLRGNVETSNTTSLDTETNTGYGGGLRWNPSPRTEAIAEYDTRIFGSSHLLAVNYRTPRTVWSISSRQGLSTGQNLGGFGSPYGQQQVGQGSAFDLLFAQFASVQPDPVLRAQLVNDFLKANGIDPNASLSTGYLPSQVTEELRQDASVAWLGARSTLIFNAYQTKARNLLTLSIPGSDFANRNQVNWLGFGLSLSHRLTPRAALTGSLAQQRTTQTQGSQKTTLWAGNLMWTYQLAERATASLSARRTVFSSTILPYNESALLASLNMRF